MAKYSFLALACVVASAAAVGRKRNRNVYHHKSSSIQQPETETRVDPKTVAQRSLQGDMSMPPLFDDESSVSTSTSTTKLLPSTCEPNEYADFNDLLDCLAHIKEGKATWANRRSCAIAIIDNNIGDLYASTGLLQDSIDTDYQLDPCYDFEPYEYAMADEIDQWLMDLSEETSVGTFAAKMKSQFVCFNDAHTGFYNELLDSVNLIPPLNVGVTLDDNGEQVFFVHDLGYFSPYFDEIVDYMNMGEQIESINGMDPLSYYLSLFKCNGLQRDESAALNNFLKINAIPGALARHVDGGLPSNGEYNVTFADGSTHYLRWGAYTSNLIPGTNSTYFSTSLEEMLDHFIEVTQGTATFYQLLKDNGIPTMCTEQVEASPTIYNGPSLDDEDESSEGEVRKLQDYEEVHLLQGSSVPDCSSFFEDRSRFDSFDISTRNPDTDICVDDGETKLCLVCLMEWDDSGLSVQRISVAQLATQEKTVTVFKSDKFDSTEYAFLFGLKVAAELAKAETNEELIIDNINNGGGDIGLGFIMNDFLYRDNPDAPSFSQPEDACEWYTIAHSPPLDYLINDVPSGAVDLTTVENPQEWLEKHLFRMKLVNNVEEMNMTDFLSYDLAGSIECIEGLLDGYSVDGSLPEEGSESFQEMQETYNSCVDDFNQCTEGGDSECYLKSLRRMIFPKSNIKPPGTDNFLSISHYDKVFMDPSYEWYHNGIERRNGDNTTTFSSRTFFACPVYPQGGEEELISIGYEPLKGGLRSIKYVTDGSCGSTCSVSTTRPYVDGLSTVITYGGVKGQPMDITSFNGGHVVNEVQGWWRYLAFDFVRSYIRTPGTPAPDAIFLPLPMKASISFANRIQSPKAFGDATMPREFLKVTGSHHLPIWSDTTFNTYTVAKSIMDSNSEALAKLLDIYSQAAAKPDKRLNACPLPAYTTELNDEGFIVKSPVESANGVLAESGEDPPDAPGDGSGDEGTDGGGLPPTPSGAARTTHDFLLGVSVLFGYYVFM